MDHAAHRVLAVARICIDRRGAVAARSRPWRHSAAADHEAAGYPRVSTELSKLRDVTTLN